MRERSGLPDRAGSPRPENVREVLSRSRTTGGGVLVVGRAAEVVRARFPPGEYAPPPWGHLLALRPSGPRRRVWRTDGRTLEGTVGADDVGVAPAGQSFTFEFEETTEALSVVLHEGFVGQVAERAGADPSRLEVLERFCVPDEQARRLVASFVPELGGGQGLGGELYAEALATQLAVHLLRRHSSLGRRAAQELARVPAGPVPKRSISRAVDYVNDNLAGNLSLAEMAEAAGYSPHHFARLFKEATGLPPHRYVIQRRVERAKDLLVRGVALGEVARLVGFSDQSHLARHFRRSTGLTPSDFRQKARPGKRKTARTYAEPQERPSRRWPRPLG